MTVIGFLVLSRSLWVVVALVDFAQSLERGPAVVARTQVFGGMRIDEKGSR